MPVHKTPSGKWKYGSSGKEYASKAAAEKQAAAIHISQAREAGHKIPKKSKGK